MNPFAVVAGVGVDRAELPCPPRVFDHALDMLDIRCRAAHRRQRHDQVRIAIHRDRQFGPASIGHRVVEIRCFEAPLATPDEVSADVPGFEPAAVDREAFDAIVLFHRHHNRRVEHAIGQPFSEQPTRCFVQCRVIGDAFEPEHAAQLGQVVEVSFDAAVVGTEERLEYEAGEQLGLGEDLGGKAVRVIRQGLSADLQRHDGHRPWRLAGQAHPSVSNRDHHVAQPNGRQTLRGFRQSRLIPFPAPQGTYDKDASIAR